jgi:hypothetical protein
MTRRSFTRIRLWRPRFTIGGLMIAILVIALVLTALKPLAGFLEAANPALAKLMNEVATPETGIVLTCLVVGGFVTMKLMSLDEKMT